MPVLTKPKEKQFVELIPRKALIAAETDVLVVGGSLAGMGAAWAAAQTGARVVLAERSGYLGGDATQALVTILMSYRTQHPREPQPGEVGLFPLDYGDDKTAVEGLYLILVDRLVKAGGAIRPSVDTGFTLTIDPEIFKLVALDLMDDAGVEMLFYASANDVIGANRIDGVAFDTKSGPIVIKAKTVVDCTGDGDVAAFSGAPFKAGRETDGYSQPITLFFTLGGFRRGAFSEYVKQHPAQWHDVYGLWQLMDKAEAAGELNLQRENILMFGTMREDEVIVDTTRVVKVSGIDVWDLTRAQRENMRQMHALAAFFKKYVPGFEKSFIARSGEELYVRESRRILGDYVLTADDILSGRKFDDVIARGAYCIDVHNPVGKGTYVRHLPPGVIYDIPLRCLIPQKTENLLVAGRCISGTHESLASYRIMPIGMATGQAAGVCAALAVRQGKTPRQMDVREVQQVLIQQKAGLGRGTPEVVHA